MGLLCYPRDPQCKEESGSGGGRSQTMKLRVRYILSSPFKIVLTVCGGSAHRRNWQWGSGGLPRSLPLTTHPQTMQRLESAF